MHPRLASAGMSLARMYTLRTCVGFWIPFVIQTSRIGTSGMLALPQGQVKESVLQPTKSGQGCTQLEKGDRHLRPAGFGASPLSLAVHSTGSAIMISHCGAVVVSGEGVAWMRGAQ